MRCSFMGSRGRAENMVSCNQSTAAELDDDKRSGSMVSCSLLVIMS